MTFDVAMVAPLIANINAALGFIIPELLLLLLMVIIIVTMVTDNNTTILHRLYSRLIYVSHQSIIVMISPVD